MSTIAVAAIAYVGLVLLLRLAGKRVLSKWNAFDFIVTVALGSSFASAVISEQTPLVQAISVFVALVGLQFLVTRLSVLFPWFEMIVKARPSLLLYRGHLQRTAMHEERVTEAEILSAVRAAGASAVEEVGAVVLETDGSFSVLLELGDASRSALKDVRGYSEFSEKIDSSAT